MYISGSSCPPDSNVNIYTDPACAISTFNSLWSPKLTPRRFQNINNVLAWQGIKYIIKLKVHLHKSTSSLRRLFKWRGWQHRQTGSLQPYTFTNISFRTPWPTWSSVIQQWNNYWSRYTESSQKTIKLSFIWTTFITYTTVDYQRFHPWTKDWLGIRTILDQI